MLSILRRIGLLDSELSPDGHTTVGILPMLWQWAEDSADFIVCDWNTTWRCIRQDHAWVNRLLPGDATVAPAQAPIESFTVTGTGTPTGGTFTLYGKTKS